MSRQNSNFGSQGEPEPAREADGGAGTGGIAPELEAASDAGTPRSSLALRRKLAAILAADVAGYGTLFAEDEEATLRRLEVCRGVFDQCVSRYDGRIFNASGDVVLAEFASAVDAVRCALDVQENLKTGNLSYVPDKRMEFRIGITVGDVVERGSDLLGDGVNIAARLQAMARPGGICVSRWVYEQVGNKVTARYQDLGLRKAKDIAQPIHAYAILLQGETAEVASPGRPSPQTRRVPGADRRALRLGAAGLAVIALVAGVLLIGRLQGRAPGQVAVVVPPREAAVAAVEQAAQVPVAVSNAEYRQLFSMVETQGKAVSQGARDAVQGQSSGAKSTATVAPDKPAEGVAPAKMVSWWQWLSGWGSTGPDPARPARTSTTPDALQGVTTRLPMLVYPTVAPAIPPPSVAVLPPRSVLPSEPPPPPRPQPVALPVAPVEPPIPEALPKLQELPEPAVGPAATVAVPLPVPVQPAPPLSAPERPAAVAPGPVNLFPHQREQARPPQAVAADRKRGRASVCVEIIERAQLGELSDDDRAVLQRDCRK